VVAVEAEAAVAAVGGEGAAAHPAVGELLAAVAGTAEVLPAAMAAAAAEGEGVGEGMDVDIGEEQAAAAAAAGEEGHYVRRLWDGVDAAGAAVGGGGVLQPAVGLVAKVRGESEEGGVMRCNEGGFFVT